PIFGSVVDRAGFCTGDTIRGKIGRSTLCKAEPDLRTTISRAEGFIHPETVLVERASTVVKVERVKLALDNCISYERLLSSREQHVYNNRNCDDLLNTCLRIFPLLPFGFIE